MASSVLLTPELEYSLSCRGGSEYAKQSFVIRVSEDGDTKNNSQYTSTATLTKIGDNTNLDTIIIKDSKNRVYTNINDYINHFRSGFQKSGWTDVDVYMKDSWINGNDFYKNTLPSGVFYNDFFVEPEDDVIFGPVSSPCHHSFADRESWKIRPCRVKNNKEEKCTWITGTITRNKTYENPAKNELYSTYDITLNSSAIPYNVTVSEYGELIRNRPMLGEEGWTCFEIEVENEWYRADMVSYYLFGISVMQSKNTWVML